MANAKEARPSPTPILHAQTDPYRMTVLRGLALVLVSLIAFVSTTAFTVYRALSSQLASNTIDTTGLGATGDGELRAPADSFEGRAVNLLVVGTDSRQGQDPDFGNEDDVEGIRADSTMLIHISTDRSRIHVVSIPRDLLVDVPACVRADGSVSEPVDNTMFNSSMTVGANWGYDIGSGAACTVSTVERLSGLTIDAFAVVDFTGFIAIIDALGGVWLDVPSDIDDPEAALRLSAGCQQLNGAQALGYARARKSLGDGSDISRIGRQKELIAAMLTEVLSKNPITDVASIVSFMKAALASVYPSPGLADLNTDVGLLASVAGIDRASIQFVTLPFEYPEWAPARVVALDDEAETLWTALGADQPLPVGIAYTDGNGVEGRVPDPAAAQSSSGQESSNDDNTDGGSSTRTPTPDSPPASVITCPPGR